jgi:hypothetical protein
MKNQLCFTLKVRAGARTPVYVSCDPLCVNDDTINVDGHKLVRATEIANRVAESVCNYLEWNVMRTPPAVAAVDKFLAEECVAMSTKWGHIQEFRAWLLKTPRGTDEKAATQQ